MSIDGPFESSDQLRVDTIVLRMRADEADVDDAVRVVDFDDQAILVTRQIEDCAAFLEDARVAEIRLHIRRRRPIRAGGMCNANALQLSL